MPGGVLQDSAAGDKAGVAELGPGELSAIVINIMSRACLEGAPYGWVRDTVLCWHGLAGLCMGWCVLAHSHVQMSSEGPIRAAVLCALWSAVLLDSAEALPREFSSEH